MLHHAGRLLLGIVGTVYMACGDGEAHAPTEVSHPKSGIMSLFVYFPAISHQSRMPVQIDQQHEHVQINLLLQSWRVLQFLSKNRVVRLCWSLSLR